MKSTLSCPQRNVAQIRTGSLLIDSVAAVALLSAAVIGVAKLATAQSEVRRQAELRLVAELIADNQLERLRGLSIDDVSSVIDSAIPVPANLRLELNSEPFESPSVTGMHIVIRVNHNQSASQTKVDQYLVARHSWIVKPADNGQDSEQDATP